MTGDGPGRSAVLREAAYALTRAAAIMQRASEAAPMHEMAQRLHEYADDWALEGGAMDSDIPFVAVADGEEPPWGDDRTCPECGAADLPLRESVTVSSTGPGPFPTLHYIAHCGQSWLRGPIGRRER